MTPLTTNGTPLTDDEIENMIELYVRKLAERDYKRARILLTTLAVDLIDEFILNPEKRAR
jgi:hypothetical protein